ncbi:thiamine phosphate synthase [Halalkalirubrum salinum]|uniref:thiamine phosphate synthase n=1 Tax=Halalkalirubrum salinum TaxID=2563889 RepID=UPI0010FB51E2|nr:thiamine phosphate synthase [Halalkalirubrum salinum]
MNNWQTYLVTQASVSGDRSTLEVVEGAIAGGIDVVQLREKGVDARSRYELGVELRELTAAHDVPLLVNDRADLAAAIDADGVHLGQSDLPIEAARELLGEDAIVGCSASRVSAARAAVNAGVDYLGVGAVYETTSKDVSGDRNGIGLDRVSVIAEAVDVPIVAIGGITAQNAAAVRTAGADCVAVVSEIAAAEDPEAATRSLVAAGTGVSADV